MATMRPIKPDVQLAKVSPSVSAHHSQALSRRSKPRTASRRQSSICLQERTGPLASLAAYDSAREPDLSVFGEDNSLCTPILPLDVFGDQWVRAQQGAPYRNVQAWLHRYPSWCL